jgi:hypothetical protein
MHTDLSIERARRHTSHNEKSGFEGIFSIASEEKASENLILAKGAL